VSIFKIEGVYVSFKETSREVNVIFPLINYTPKTNKLFMILYKYVHAGLRDWAV